MSVAEMKFNKLIVFLAISITSSYGGVLPDLSKDVNERIIGGEEATIDEAPYQVAMFFKLSPETTVLRCGGSIISPNTVLTAAHCIYGTYVTDWLIRAGSTDNRIGGQLKELISAVLHANYEKDRFDYDIALLFPKESFKLDGIYIALIGLPLEESLPDGTLGLFTGWGALAELGKTSSFLRKVSISIVNQQDCEDAYERGLVNERMVCAGYFPGGGKAPCNGDFGGPLAVDNVLVGVASWAAGCGRRAFPTVFSRVWSYKGWITAHMKP